MISSNCLKSDFTYLEAHNVHFMVDLSKFVYKITSKGDDHDDHQHNNHFLVLPSDVYNAFTLFCSYAAFRPRCGIELNGKSAVTFCQSAKRFANILLIACIISFIVVCNLSGLTSPYTVSCSIIVPTFTSVRQGLFRFKLSLLCKHNLEINRFQ